MAPYYLKQVPLLPTLVDAVPTWILRPARRLLSEAFTRGMFGISFSYSTKCLSVPKANENFSISCEQEKSSNNFSEIWSQSANVTEVKVLAKCRSQFSEIQVLEIARWADSPLAGARLLLLDGPGNIHSVHYQFKIITKSYYDFLASLPPLLPEGPIGIYGLGGGTVARMIYHFWPHIELHGWELDPAVIAMARKFFDLSELEEGKDALEGVQESRETDAKMIYLTSPSYKLDLAERMDMEVEGFEHDRHTDVKPKGRLTVHIGDALSPNATIEGGFAGLIVDMFSKGVVLPELQKPETWVLLKQRLKPGGRIMVNCGGACVESELGKDGLFIMQQTLDALEIAFPGQTLKRNVRLGGDNVVALTGCMPDISRWRRSLPKCLKVGLSDWIEHQGTS